MQLGDKTAFGLGGIGFGAAAMGMTIEHVAPHLAPWVWQSIFYCGIFAILLSVIYLAYLHLSWRGRVIPILLMVIGAGVFFSGAIWLGLVNSSSEVERPKEQDTPFVYVIPHFVGNSLQALYAAIGARGTARQHNVDFYFTALTKEKPMKGAGGFFAPILDPGSTSTQWEMDIGNYFITMRSDNGLFRESLTVELADGQIKQTIRILDEKDNEVLKMKMP